MVCVDCRHAQIKIKKITVKNAVSMIRHNNKIHERFLKSSIFYFRLKLSV